MSEHVHWPSSTVEELSGGTRSSQDTLCSHDNASFAQDKSDEQELLHNCNDERKLCLTPHSKTPNLFPTISNQNISFSRESSKSLHNLDPVFIDEDTQMCVNHLEESNIAIESPNDITSPGCEPGDISSPFETMESDDLNDPDDSILSGASASVRRVKWTSEPLSTPRDSSDEDPYASSGSRKKRRRLKKEMHPSDNFAQSHLQYYSPSPQISSPVPNADMINGDNVNYFNIASGLSKSRASQQVCNSDSGLFTALLKNNRRASNASESNQSSISCTRDTTLSVAENSMSATTSSFIVDAEVAVNSESNLTQKMRSSGLNEKDYSKVMSLQENFPSSSNGVTLEILVQPEDHHRARYLTEGSRGPVKDRLQQGYPQLKLKGYTGKAILQVYVGSDSQEKVRPHGFYQACKVTGRNTTACDEIEIEGTKVMHISVDAQEAEPISVDCVGILKLRNADVELRIGPNQAKKRSQTARLVFRVFLDMPNESTPNLVCLQVVSDRISCTQLRGQPEIIKKSLERCSVEGNQEMFIIGRNFHRGTKVIFQDSEEPDGSHWHQSGQIDKDTFNQSHMIVHIPPYHDQTITKSVNVQVFVEYDGRKCDPHSFTYDPIPKQSHKDVSNQEKDCKKDSEDRLENILASSKIDRKVLEALFAKLLCSSDVDAVENTSKSQESTETTAVPSVVVSQASSNPPLRFAPSNTLLLLPVTVQKPVPVQTIAVSAVTNRLLIQPNTFHTPAASSTIVSNAVVMSSQPFKSPANNSAIASSASPVASSDPLTIERSSAFQIPSGSVAASLLTTTAAVLTPIVKNEEQAKVWPAQQQVTTPLSGNTVSHFSIPQCSNENVFPLASSVIFSTSVPQPNIVINNPSVQQQSLSLTSVLSQIVNTPSVQSAQGTPADVISRIVGYNSTLQQTEQNQNNSIVHVIDNNNQPVGAISLQTTTPAQESLAENSAFAAQGNQWQSQISNPVSEVNFNQPVVSSPTSMFVDLTQQALPPTNTISANQAVNVQTSASMQGIRNWVPSEPDVEMLSQNTNSQSAMQWQPMPQQNQANSNTSLQHSSSGELIFRDSSFRNSTPNQQQVFTISNAINIFDPQKQNVAIATQEPLTNSDSFSSTSLPPTLNTLSSHAVDSNSHILENSVLADSDLNFESNFSLNASKVMDNSAFQTLFSDCLNSSSGPVEDTQVFQQKLITPSHVSDTNTYTNVSSFASQNTVNKSNINMNQVAPVHAPQHQPSPTQIEMFPAHLEKNEFQHTSNDTTGIYLNQQVVNLVNSPRDTSLFVVNPNDVQQQRNSTTNLANTDQQPVTPSYNMTTSIHENVSLLSTDNSTNPESLSTSEIFRTIDPSVISIASGTSNTLDQVFTSFTQSSNNPGS